jgi:hypothetical protein
MIKKNSEVFLTKVKDLNARSPLDINYFVIGILEEDLCLNQPISIFRSESSKHGAGVQCAGIFRSSPIQYLDIENPDKVFVHTQNSVYLIKSYGNSE